jgi:hypothetical protein
MKLYSIDVQIAGTLYIRANNLEEAKKLLAKSIDTKAGTYLEVVWRSRECRPILRLAASTSMTKTSPMSACHQS